MILGIDEVGRGPWAGPLVVGAVVLGEDEIPGLNDSKKLTDKKRRALDPIIREKALGYGLGWVHADELDKIGLSAALILATKRAVEQVKTPYHRIVIDGTINFLKDTNKGEYVTTMPKADAVVPSVSAASIIAKVARDTYMAEQDAIYEGYSFSKHVGYGTKAHRDAIDLLGVTPLHRLSFAPLAQYRTVTTKAIGDNAEDAVALFLKTEGFTILERNWKTKFAEIDCVAEKNGTLYIVEVKYRKTDRQGGGLAAIDARKLSKLRLGAELYLARHKKEQPVRLVAVATSGTPPVVDELVEIE